MIHKQGNKIWDKGSQKNEKQATLTDKAEKKRRDDAVSVVRAHQYKRIMEYHGGDSNDIVKHLEGEAPVLVKWKADIDKLTTRYRG